MALLGLGVAVVGAAGTWVAAASTPDLGPAPGGPGDGDSVFAIATGLATRLRPELARSPHATVGLSERDLTVIAREENPQPQRFRDPEVRVRDGLLVVDARTDVGPVAVVAVGRFRVQLVTGGDGSPDIGLSLTSVQAGRLPLPGFVGRLVQDRLERALGFGGILGATPLAVFRPELDCVAVVPGALVLGFHRPGAAADPRGCVGAAAPTAA